MELDPKTTVGNLLRGVPSSALAFEKVGVRTGENQTSTLQEACVGSGVSFEEFLRAMDEIDWSGEAAGAQQNGRVLGKRAGEQHL